jgi:subtilisin
MLTNRFYFFFGVVILVGLFLPPSVKSQGASENHRRIPFIIFSEDPGLKKSLGVRHTFPGMFTANLSLAQSHALNLAGIRTERVRLYHLSPPPGSCSPWPECKNGGGGGDGGATSRIATPDDPTPWGVETIYDDPSLQTTIGGGAVNVAVLDTGVFSDHLDLKGRLEQCVDFTGGGPPGTVRIMEGACDDKDGHGTHVAGTILGDSGSDGLGVFGIAPEASLLAYRVCGGSGCWTDDIAAAIDYAGGYGAQIVSMSLGGDGESILIKDAIGRNPHLLFIAAAGNDGPAIGSVDFPAANPNVVAVGAIDRNGQVPSWSSRGVNDADSVIEERELEFTAPGVSVESTWNDGTYRYLSGTSMATPHVTGLAAKFWSGNAATTRAYLQSLAPNNMANDPAIGFGLPRVP